MAKMTFEDRRSLFERARYDAPDRHSRVWTLGMTMPLSKYDLEQDPEFYDRGTFWYRWHVVRKPAPDRRTEIPIWPRDLDR